MSEAKWSAAERCGASERSERCERTNVASDRVALSKRDCHTSSNTPLIGQFSLNFTALHLSIDKKENAFRKKKMKRKLGPVSTRDNRVLKGPLGRSLRSFARTAHSTHSTHSLRSDLLRYARFACSLRTQTRSLTLLTPSWDS